MLKKQLTGKLALLKHKKRRATCENYLALFILLFTLLFFFLCGCTSPYEKAYMLKPPKPVMKPVPVSSPVKMIRERETDPEAIYDDVENVFVIPPELEF